MREQPKPLKACVTNDDKSTDNSNKNAKNKNENRNDHDGISV